MKVFSNLNYSMLLWLFFIFLIRQKLDKHADTSKSKYQNIGLLYFWNIKIFEGFGFLGALFCLDRTWENRAKMQNTLKDICGNSPG